MAVVGYMRLLGAVQPDGDMPVTSRMLCRWSDAHDDPRGPPSFSAARVPLLHYRGVPARSKSCYVCLSRTQRKQATQQAAQRMQASPSMERAIFTQAHCNCNYTRQRSAVAESPPVITTASLTDRENQNFWVQFSASRWNNMPITGALSRCNRRRNTHVYSEYIIFYLLYLYILSGGGVQGYSSSCFCELEELLNQNLPAEYQFLLDIVDVEQMANLCDTKHMGGDVYYRCAHPLPEHCLRTAPSVP